MGMVIDGCHWTRAIDLLDAVDWGGGGASSVSMVGGVFPRFLELVHF